ncbi:MAG: IS200/IS605 family transposase [Dehalococcoidia bacterium]
MAETRYRRSAGSVFSLKYHLVWCPKYRRSVLVGPVEDRLKALVREKAATLNVEIEALEVMPDRVHLYVSAEPTEAVQHLVNQFKGYTSRILRQEFPGLRSRLPSLWSRSYYAGTVGHASEATVRRYIEAQKGR